MDIHPSPFCLAHGAGSHHALRRHDRRNDENARWVKPDFRKCTALSGRMASHQLSGLDKVPSRLDAILASPRLAICLPGTLRFAGRFLRYEHEQAYLLAKADVASPRS